MEGSPQPTAEELAAENERLRAELDAARGIEEPAGRYPTGETPPGPTDEEIADENRSLRDRIEGRQVEAEDEKDTAIADDDLSVGGVAWENGIPVIVLRARDEDGNAVVGRFADVVTTAGGLTSDPAEAETDEV